MVFRADLSLAALWALVGIVIVLGGVVTEGERGRFDGVGGWMLGLTGAEASSTDVCTDVC